MSLDSVVVCGSEVVGLALQGARGKDARGKEAQERRAREQVPQMEKHIVRILNSNGYFNANVRIFTDLKHFEERIRLIAADPEKYRSGISFKPDERYPGLSREELVLHTIMAISV